MKKFRKLLAIVLSLGILASFCAIPMTNASADTPAGETYESATQIGYSDLIADDSGNALGGSSYRVSIGGRVLRYTSSTFSTVVKFRWQATGSSTNTSFNVSFDIDTVGGTNISYPFGFDVSSSDGVLDINRVRFQPGIGNETMLDAPIMFGSIHDIEMGRLKVLTGSNAGKYYFYVKFDGELMGEDYVTVDANDQYTYSRSGSDHTVTMINKILIGTWGRGGDDKIMPSYSGETYYAHDDITMSDLTKTAAGSGSYNANTGSMSGACTFTYPATKEDYSAVLKYRWTPGIDDANISNSFERNDLNPTHPFGWRAEKTNDSGSATKGAWHYYASDDSKRVLMKSIVTAGTTYLVELGRVKVATGTNAGKYYGYLKIDGQLMGDAYVTVNNDGTYTSGSITPTIGNEILFYTAGANNAKITDVQTEETYETADYIGYSDLKSGGSAVTSGGRTMGGGNELFTYDADSYSNILTFVWRAGVTKTNEVKIAFDTRNADMPTNEFGFAVKASSGAESIDTLYFRDNTSYAVKQLASPILIGDEHNIEMGRLKVTSGTKTGKYYFYVKFDGELIGEKYITVDGNNQYTDSVSGTTVTLSKSIRIYTSGRGGSDYITDLVIPETYETPTVIGYSDLKDGGSYLSGTETTMGNGSKQFTYDSDTLSTVIKLRWRVGVANINDFKLSFDEVGDQISDPFGFGVKAASGASTINKVVFQNGLNTASKTLDAETAINDEHNIELGRLKVLSGYKTGRYYVYLKFDDELIGSAYVKVNESNQYTASDTTVTMGNSIRFVTFGRGGADAIKEFYVAETYAAYDEISYTDLLVNGDPVSTSGTVFSNESKTFTYNATSPTYSAIFKYRWKVGSKSKFQLSFDKYGDNTMSYMFGAKLEEPHDSFLNGEMWLRPGCVNTAQINLPTALSSGTSHNIEFARLKVLTGRNTGKYYVYIKIDDVLIDESYFEANVVDSSGNYTSNGANLPFTLSNQILFNFWGSNQNIISNYFVPVDGHVGTRGDFDDSGAIDSADITSLINVLIGTTNIQDLADEDMADFNNDGARNILDLISMKRYLAPINTYTKTGSLSVGTQEHLLDDVTKTAEYIADATAAIGADTYRLSRPINSLFYVSDAANNVTINTTNMTQFKGMVAALKAQGIDDILYVTDAFLLPYGYSNSSINHNKTVPTYGTEDYENWLKVNANAFTLLAAEVPDIKFFEPFNEINATGTRLEKPGVAWSSTELEQASYKFTVDEKVQIMADLCWNVSNAVKSVNSANQVTTPSICVGSNNSNIQSTFLNKFYQAIETGAYPSNKNVGDLRVDNFFTIINIHIYPQYGLNASQYNSNLTTAANELTAAYTTARAHGDGGSQFWITETGVSTGDGRTESNCGDMLYALLAKFDTSTTFVDTVIIYKLSDDNNENNDDRIEPYYGLFYYGDDLDNPYGVKETAKAVYRFTHGGSTDYSALNSLVSRWAS